MQRAVSRASARRDSRRERQRAAKSSTATLAFLDNDVDSLTGTVTGKATLRERRSAAVAGRAGVPHRSDARCNAA